MEFFLSQSVYAPVLPHGLHFVTHFSVPRLNAEIVTKHCPLLKASVN